MRLGKTQLFAILLGGFVQMGCFECEVSDDVSVDLTEAQSEKLFGELDRANGGTVKAPPPDFCKEVCTQLLGDDKWEKCSRDFFLREEPAVDSPGGAGGDCTWDTTEFCDTDLELNCIRRVPFEGCGW